jgi:hypothetical protein
MMNGTSSTWKLAATREREPLQHYIVTIEGPNFNDVEEIELPSLPIAGDPVDTKYGTCIVASSEELSDNPRFDGKIVCRMP